MILYHFTCEDAAPLIEKCGHLLPYPQVQLDGRKLVWLTDLDAPTRATLGLTSIRLHCDRMQYRVKVDVDAIRWVQYARQFTGPARRRALALNEAPGVLPLHWLVLAEPVPVLSVERGPVSRRDPGAASGGAVREPGRCHCGHTEPIHALRNGHRTGCSASTCNCKTYEDACDVES